MPEADAEGASPLAEDDKQSNERGTFSICLRFRCFFKEEARSSRPLFHTEKTRAHTKME
jgi:hypothetical protein